MQQAGWRVCARLQGAPRPIPQPDPCRGGKTRSWFLTAEQAALAWQPIDSGGEFRVWGSLPVWADEPARLLQGGAKSGLPTELQGEISQETERLLGHQAVADLDCEAVERAARPQALRLAARELEQRLNADLSDPAGPPWTDRCGGVAEYPGRHQKTFESVRGPQHWQRAYYPCAPSGFGPRDHALRWELFGLPLEFCG